MKIHLIRGSTSQYEDYTEWIVCAVVDHEEAKAYCVKANARAKEIFDYFESVGWYNCDREKICRGNEYDKNMHMDYPGTEYRIITTEISTPIEMKYMGLKLFFNKILRFLRIK